VRSELQVITLSFAEGISSSGRYEENAAPYVIYVTLCVFGETKGLGVVPEW
jgi:hypothetical protein